MNEGMERMDVRSQPLAARRGQAPAPRAAPAPGKVLLVTEVPEQKTAWTKARKDVLALMQADGWDVLPLPQGSSPREWLRLYAELGARVDAGAQVLIEYPFEQRRRAWPVYLFCRWQQVRLYALIHDLNSLRYADSAASRELAILKLFDGLISHNPSMSDWLRQSGFEARIEDLHLFDYVAEPGRHWHERGMSAPLKVLSAGNLSFPKASWVYDERLQELQGVELSLYGAFYEPERPHAPSVRYKGVFDPESPVLDGAYHFGLVWDGSGVESCEGNYGHYMRFNNPHKLSLYACMGLPVIVWKEAAIARFVEERNIGVTVSDLRELGDIAGRIDSPAYRQMARNAVDLSGQVREGRFLRQALERLQA